MADNEEGNKTMTKETTNGNGRAPLDRISDGGSFAKLWEAKTEKGQRFVNIQVGRVYKDQSTGEFKETNVVTWTQALKLEGVIRKAGEEAKKWEDYFRIQDREQSQEQEVQSAAPEINSQQQGLAAQRDQALANAKEPTARAAPSPEIMPDR